MKMIVINLLHWAYQNVIIPLSLIFALSLSLYLLQPWHAVSWGRGIVETPPTSCPSDWWSMSPVADRDLQLDLRWKSRGVCVCEYTL